MLLFETAPVRQSLVFPVYAGQPSGGGANRLPSSRLSRLRNANSFAGAGSLGQDVAGQDARRTPGSAGLSTAFLLALLASDQVWRKLKSEIGVTHDDQPRKQLFNDTGGLCQEES